MQSVGHAYAVLKGYRMGDRKEAHNFLQSMHPTERILRNRNESKLRAKAKARYIRGRR